MKILRTLNSVEVRDHPLVKATKFRMAMAEVEEAAPVQIETGLQIGVAILTKIEGALVIDLMEVVVAEATDKMMASREENSKIEALIKEIGVPISEDSLKIIKGTLRETLVPIDKMIQGRDRVHLIGSTIIGQGMFHRKHNLCLMTMITTRIKTIDLSI